MATSSYAVRRPNGVSAMRLASSSLPRLEPIMGGAKARVDGVGTNAVGAVLEGEVLGEQSYGALGGDIT